MQGGRATPYDVLSRFSESLTGEIEPGDRPSSRCGWRACSPRAPGRGGPRSGSWSTASRSWRPPGPRSPGPSSTGWTRDQPGLRSLDVTLDGARLGILRLQEHRDQPLSPVEERLFAGLAAQAGLVLRGARLRAELARRADDLATLAEDLQASRRRVVDAHDSERRRLERDIHDGAQQHLVALVVNLRLAQTLTARSPDRARAVLAEQGDAVDNAITSLVDLSRGIYPKVLTEDGVAAAVRDVVGSSTIPVAVLDHGIGRHDAELETALYFCCVEAVQNAVKHAAAGRIEVELANVGDRIELLVRDDGHGFDVAAVLAAGGLGNLRDRVDSVGGDLAVRTNEAGGTDVVVISAEPRWPDVGARHGSRGLAAGISLVLAVVDTALVAASYPPFSMRSTGIHGWPLVNLAGLGSAVLGAVILTAHPRHPIGWILNLIGLSTSISLATESYGIWVLQYDGHGSAAQGHLAGWVAAVLGGPTGAGAASPASSCWCPSGTYLSHRWRWVARVGVGGVRACTWSGSSSSARTASTAAGTPSMPGLVAQVLLSGGVVLITLMLLASVVAMLRRLRGSTGAARQQLRVVTLGAAGVGLALLVLVIGQSLNDGRQSWWSSVPLYVSYVVLVVCIAVAVLRYRLYEVEVIVSRAAGARDRHGVRGGRLRRPGRAARSHRGGQDRRRVLVVVAGHGGRGAGVPAAATPGPPARRPPGLREPGRAVRRARRLQRTDRPQPRDRRAAADDRRGRGRGGARTTGGRPARR